ncbi:hypothetical protein Adi01nite_70260 [Amorphoplanes digitatis]|nr:hypothetical protein GCM10020092_002180 [Actinoplanes digitatis]GID97614.1 hypothetical protein Adi01nite_70260 [Actinoplanes digitatis]
MPFVTIGTEAEPFATEGPAGRFGSVCASLSAVGSPGGGVMPGARVNFGWVGASAGTAARPAGSRPAEGVPSVFDPSSTGVAEDPGPPDFACVSGIN